MGQAFDREGNVLGEAEGATRAEVLAKLEKAHGDVASEIRIRSIEVPTPTLGRVVFFYPTDDHRNPTMAPLAAHVAKVENGYLRLWVLDADFGNRFESVPISQYGTNRGCWTWPPRV